MALLSCSADALLADDDAAPVLTLDGGEIDACLGASRRGCCTRGGWPSHGITEVRPRAPARRQHGQLKGIKPHSSVGLLSLPVQIAGESSAGKTQFCMALALRVSPARDAAPCRPLQRDAAVRHPVLVHCCRRSPAGRAAALRLQRRGAGR